MIPLRSLLLIALLGGALARAADPVETETIVTADAADIQSTDSETTSDFTGNVVLTGTNMKLTCDRMIVVTSRITDKTATVGNPTGLKSALAIGHVHLTQNAGLREAFCGQAEVFPKEDKIVLTQKPVVIDRANNSQATGVVLVILRGQRRVTGEHVQFTLPHFKDLGFDKNEAPPTSSLSTAPSAVTTPSADAPAKQP